MYILFIIHHHRYRNNYIFNMKDNSKYPIAEFADTFWDEIRNPQLQKCAEAIEEKCREYGLRDVEFRIVIDFVESSLFTYVDLIDSDDSEDLDDLEDSE